MAQQAKTVQEVIDRLNKLDGSDKEGLHEEADSLLADALLAAGMKDVVDAFLLARQRVGFWYS